MALIKQIGVGRKTTGTIDGITYVTRGGMTYARSTPTMPASAYNTPAAKRRQALFKLIQMHLKYHLRTIRQTFSPKGIGTPANRYYSINAKALGIALTPLADRLVAGEDITITDVEAAITAYATEHPKSIRIASLSGYQEVFLTGAWPETITLNTNGGDNTMIIIVAENGVTTTYNPDGSTIVAQGSNGSSSGSSEQGSSSSTEQVSGSSVAAPTISGVMSFAESTQVTMSAESGAEIRYTTDGSTPTASSTLYSEAITLSETTTIKAIAIKNGVSSSVSSKTFTKSSGGNGNGPSE